MIGAAAGRATAAAIGDATSTRRPTTRSPTRRGGPHPRGARSARRQDAPAGRRAVRLPCRHRRLRRVHAIIDFGGGYDHDSLEQYFAFLDIPMPDVSDVLIAGGVNRPGISEPVDGEVSLDIEVIGGAAPGARLVCYFGPLTGLGFVEAIRHRGARPCQPTVGDLGELGPVRGVLAADARHRRPDGGGARRGGAARHHRRVLRRGLRDADGVPRRPGVGRLPGVEPARDRVRRHDARAERCGDRCRDGVEHLGGDGPGHGRWIQPDVPGAGVAAGRHAPDFAQRRAPRGRGVPDVAANADPRTGYLVQVTEKHPTVSPPPPPAPSSASTPRASCSPASASSTSSTPARSTSSTCSPATAPTPPGSRSGPTPTG